MDQLLTKEQQSELLFMWFAEHGTPDPDRPFKQYKNLQKVWDEYPDFNAATTTIFDDSEFKLCKQPNNLHLVTLLLAPYIAPPTMY